MIVAELKKLETIKTMIKHFERVLIVGCGTCVSICFTGGEREVELLATELKLARKLEGQDIEIGQQTIKRQCDNEFIDDLKEVKKYQAILSLACGAGVQFLAKKFPEISVLPGSDTLFIGINESQGFFTEQCKACGECILHLTSGICPLARCAKGILNGPCGGSDNGKCEISEEKDCVWILIFEQFQKRGNIKRFGEIIEAKDYSKAGNIRSFDLRMQRKGKNEISRFA